MDTLRCKCRSAPLHIVAALSARPCINIIIPRLPHLSFITHALCSATRSVVHYPLHVKCLYIICILSFPLSHQLLEPSPCMCQHIGPIKPILVLILLIQLDLVCPIQASSGPKSSTMKHSNAGALEKVGTKGDMSLAIVKHPPTPLFPDIPIKHTELVCYPLHKTQRLNSCYYDIWVTYHPSTLPHQCRPTVH